MNLTEAKATPDVTDDDVARAETEAAEAEQAAATLERAAVDGEQAAKPGAVLEARAVAEFARKRARQLRGKAEQAKAAARLIALGAIAGEVNAVAAAAADSSGVEAAIRQIAAGYEQLTQHAAGHDAKVRDLIDRARDLAAEQPSPSGPRATSAHVALVHGGVGVTAGIQAGNTMVMLTGKRTAEAAVLAAQGKPGEAITHLNAVRQQQPAHRYERYYSAPAGIIGQDGPESPHTARMVRDGSLTPLTGEQVDAYLDGRLDGHQEAL